MSLGCLRFLFFSLQFLRTLGSVICVMAVAYFAVFLNASLILYLNIIYRLDTVATSPVVLR